MLWWKQKNDTCVNMGLSVRWITILNVFEIRFRWNIIAIILDPMGLLKLFTSLITVPIETNIQILCAF